MSYHDTLRDALDQGLPLAKALEFLRANGASPAEAASAVESATGLSADDAREAVARSRAWSGPRSGVHLHAGQREWYGAIGQHGRSGQGSASVLPHLGRAAQGNARAAR